MALNPKMIITADLQEYFVDKDTGLPLSGGIITFYSDDHQSTLKPVYQLTGTAPHYTYTQLPNPLVLSSVGTVQDALGNDIVIYYYPFTGNPADDSDTVEEYYITIDNSSFIRQFDRHGWPNLADETAADSSDQNNFIPNGQFVSYQTTPGQFVEQINTGSTILDVANIAYGGWVREDQHGFGGIYTTIFSSAGGGAGFLNDFPYNFLDYACAAPSIGIHQLGVKWRNVSQFEINNSPQPTYTFWFYGKSNDAGNYIFDIHIIKYFGTNGTATSDTIVGNITFTPTSGYQTINFDFGNNLGKIIGDGNYVEVALRLRGTSTFNVRVTDFVLALGNVVLNNFPVMTQAQMLSRSVAGWMPPPSPDGSSLYLPLVLTPQGMTFSDADIGKIYASPYGTPKIGELLCDGTAYTVSTYSSDGIPYNRLFKKIFNASSNISFWGSGVNFVNCYTYTPPASNLMIMTNKIGSMTAPADGGTPTGFAFAKAVGVGGNIAGATSRDFEAIANIHGAVITRCKTVGGCTPTPFSAGTSGIISVVLTNSVTTNCQVLFNALSAAALSGGVTGLYFDLSNTTITYRFWFNVIGEVAPAAGGNTLVEVQLDSAQAPSSVAAVIANTISAYQCNQVVCTSGATIPAGSYFTFVANSLTYTVWYRVSGAGTAPGGVYLIVVDITAATSAGNVAFLTQTAINSQFVATPNYQGMFLRGVESVSKYDSSLLERGSNIYNFTTNSADTFEPYFVQAHTHIATISPSQATNSATSASTYASGGGGSPRTGFTVTNADFGQAETRPINASVSWVIKY